MNQTPTGRFAGRFLLTAALSLSLILAACGGGGGSSSSTSQTGTTTSGTTTAPTSNFRSGTNVVSMSVDHDVFSAVNEPFVTVTVCSTGTPANCLTVDHILVDTGSVGLRIFDQPSNSATALSTLGLSPKTTLASANAPIGECLQFVQGNTWGPVKLANITVGQKTVSNLAIQVIQSSSDHSFSSAPSSCQTGGMQTLITTPSSFGANGVLGVGLNLQDCGTTCRDNIVDVYYSCPSSGCYGIPVALADQIQNPVSQFASDNNGVILTLNNISATGAQSTVGTLTFGVDTRANNVSANNNTILATNTSTFATSYAGRTYTDSYLDSGSNGLFFDAPSAITQCSSTQSGFYCPATALNGQTASMTGLTGSTNAATITFNIGNASTLFSTGNYVFNNIGGAAGSSSGGPYTFDWGLPFFFGRDVYIVFDGMTTTKGTGPYFGF